jgi:chorismate mutase
VKTEILPLASWNKSFSRPFIIAGPCSAESEEQMISTAKAIAGMPVNMLRAGIWKPRTRPDSFEGKGEVALGWLKNAGKAVNLPVSVEVANTKHVELALKAGIDVLWIGARTTVSPFMVQEIADSLAGVDIPVMIKNPVNPDIDLWVGAIERIANAGINKMIAIHRGFSSYENSTYRNRPNWEIPIELRRRIPGLPLICDPSHISGKTVLIPYLSQMAMDLNYEGLMVETHIDPAHALSDAKQQLTPAELEKLINHLVLRNPSVNDVFELSKLEDMRDQIDEVDQTILDHMSERMSIARLIGQYKLKNHMTIYQPERWNEIIRTRTQSGVEKGLTREFILKLISIIHEESIYQQTLQMNPDTGQKELARNDENASSFGK